MTREEARVAIVVLELDAKASDLAAAEEPAGRPGRGRAERKISTRQQQ
jgi:hypothetical protein